MKYAIGKPKELAVLQKDIGFMCVNVALVAYREIFATVFRQLFPQLTKPSTIPNSFKRLTASVAHGDLTECIVAAQTNLPIWSNH